MPKKMITMPQADNFLETVPCIICGSSDYIVQREVCDSVTGKNFTLVKCSKCGLIFVNPKVARKDIHLFYDFEHDHECVPSLPRGVDLESAQDYKLPSIRRWMLEAYFDYDFDKETKGLKIFKKVGIFFKKIFLYPYYFRLKVLTKDLNYIPMIGNGRFLEVGFGNASMLFKLKQLGWDAYGIEINRNSVIYAKEVLKLKNIYEGNFEGFEDFNFLPEFFDIVYISHTFEHFYNPL